ncbi:MAG: hypothetical protein J7494_09740 [Sphingobium sp.]|nr:hypothetical protein [Sphingobium sp.]
MNEFLPRTEPVASVVSAGERGLAGVRGVVAAAQAGSHADANAQQDAQLTERSAAMANYAKVQADIADVVARFDPPPANPAQAAQEADASIMALMPQPVVMLPLPPTDQDMIDFVAQVAQSVAGQAAMARAAHARVSPALVDAAAS